MLSEADRDLHRAHVLIPDRGRVGRVALAIHTSGRTRTLTDRTHGRGMSCKRKLPDRIDHIHGQGVLGREGIDYGREPGLLHIRGQSLDRNHRRDILLVSAKGGENT